ncbi:GIY-YIG nuclease family protein [Spirosoma pollinicola]|uniref:GIY-YIG domain-containing protein n=1 Tax=Spirosoma pollinicola TaxID=2057025 RepID=A0A2K8YTL0_9BACT|nr:GIY-YIG nuclease family protein [Spirosoma pollinicola]AUD00960.1 hypothetical protein CWM47_03485 [Spirosoma pollinicola]
MKTSHIYLLIDPRTGDEKYIGYTNKLKRRLYQHVNGANLKPYFPNTVKRNNDPDLWMCNTEKSKWIRELLNLGLTPTIQLLVTVADSHKAYYEWFWGQIYADAILVNDKPFNKESITGI